MTAPTRQFSDLVAALAAKEEPLRRSRPHRWRPVPVGETAIL
jgi:hypothetical protein